MGNFHCPDWVGLKDESILTDSPNCPTGTTVTLTPERTCAQRNYLKGCANKTWELKHLETSVTFTTSSLSRSGLGTGLAVVDACSTSIFRMGYGVFSYLWDDIDSQCFWLAALYSTGQVAADFGEHGLRILSSLPRMSKPKLVVRCSRCLTFDLIFFLKETCCTTTTRRRTTLASRI